MGVLIQQFGGGGGGGGGTYAPVTRVYNDIADFSFQDNNPGGSNPLTLLNITIRIVDLSAGVGLFYADIGFAMPVAPGANGFESVTFVSDPIFNNVIQTTIAGFASPDVANTSNPMQMDLANVGPPTGLILTSTLEIVGNHSSQFLGNSFSCSANGWFLYTP
jgi:hypothetical protein